MEPNQAEVAITLADYVHRHRVAAHLSLREVEERTAGHVKNGYLNQIEKGKIRAPSPTMLKELAPAIGASFEELMELAGHYVPVDGREAVRPELLVLFNQLKALTDYELGVVTDVVSAVRLRAKPQR